MDDNNIELFRPDNRKVSVIINKKAYLIPTHFSMNDGERYIKELVKENNYKKSLAIIISDKIHQAEYDEIPVLQDIIDVEDEAFSEYICAIISDSEELKKIFDDIDNNLPIREKFAIAYRTYTDHIAKRLAESMRPLVESLNRDKQSVDFGWMNQMQELANKLRPVFLDVVEQSNRIVQNIAKSLQPFQQIAVSIANTISKIQIPNISQKKIERWKESYIKWGKLGWAIHPDAPFDFYNCFPEDKKIANKMAMEFCGTEAMEDLFERMHGQKIKKADLDSAIFCYKNRQYKACALLIFSLLDSKMIRLQPKHTNRSVGLGGTSKLKSKLEDKLADEHFLFTSLYGINFVTCLEVYFAKGNNFVSEPGTINRNYVDHGMNIRSVRKRDCIQLFIALHNMDEFIDYIS
ncbi:hypothetical protein I5677_13025 [Mobilitalea sibirica]|uniref:Uncharacterized protein n=1 Tax=Mobilitalea sibirica TaxID=1462919 RepID=A0A8J7H5S8_9FIRM|nr:hypothetical protein [Mobilitalea sibirica]MBH1941819.1 hypothetical protein [Mobilitalea sibirica]